MTDPLFVPTAALDWQNGVPLDRRHGDIYFNPADAMGEVQAVFLSGIGGPDLWQGRVDTVIGEMGFGTGLNFLMLWDLFERTRSGHLHVMSVEGYPMTQAALAKALAPFTNLSNKAAQLVQAWPPPIRGFHRRHFGPVSLTLMLGPADAMLAAQDGPAHAWLLDGFAPAKNPDMWSSNVFEHITRLSVPGARAASFTVAATVREGLALQGWQVEKMPGFGRKRHRLQARLPGELSGPSSEPKHVGIVGNGVAGRSIAVAAQKRGLKASLYGAGPAAADVPAGVRAPRLSLGKEPQDRLALLAHFDASYRAPSSPLILMEPDRERLERLQQRFALLSDWLPALSAGDASDTLGIQVETGGFHIPHGSLIMDTKKAVFGPPVASIGQDQNGWLIRSSTNETRVDHLIICSGPDAAQLLPGLPLQSRPGRIARFRTEMSARLPFAYGGYAIPGDDHIWLGSTFDRGTEQDPRDRLLAKLAPCAPTLAEHLAQAPVDRRWRGVRAVTRDHMPLCGAVTRHQGDAHGLYVLTALGARGHQLASLLADHILDSMQHLPRLLERDLAKAMAPDRFASGRGNENIGSLVP